MVLLLVLVWATGLHASAEQALPDAPPKSGSFALSASLMPPATNPPVAQSQSLATLRNTALEVTLSATDLDGHTPIFRVLGGPLHGALSGTLPNLIYTPAQDFTGSDAFTFQATDPTSRSSVGVVSIEVTREEGVFCPANLAVNPGFESGTDGWFSLGGQEILTAVNNPVHSGTTAIRVSNRSETWQGAAQNLLGVLQNSNTYIFSAWMMVESVTNQNFKFTLKIVDDAGPRWPAVGFYEKVAQSNGWVQIFGGFPILFSGTATELTLFVEGPAPGVNYYLDDVEVRCYTPSPDTNVLENGGFELGAVGWVGWNFSPLVVVTNPVHGERRAIRSVQRTTTFDSPAQFLNGRLSSGTTYNYSAWVRVESQTPQTIHATFYRQDGAVWSYVAPASLTGVTESQGWVQLIGTYRFVDTGNLVNLALLFDRPEPSVTFLVDDARLVPRTGPLLAQESFQYVPGTTLANQGNGPGFTNTWGSETGFVVNATSLAFPSLNTEGGSLSLVASNFRSQARPLASLMGANGTTRYVSWLVRPDVTPPTNVVRNISLRLVGTTSALVLGKMGTTLRYSMETTGGSGRVSSTATVTSGTTVLLVLRCNFAAGNDIFTLHVNPTPGGLEPGTGIVKSDLDLGTVYSMEIVGDVAFTMDEVRIGETFESVVPSTCAPVIFQSPSNLPLEAGSPAVLNVVAGGAEPKGYQWRKNGLVLGDGGPVSGATTATLTVSPAALSDSGDYDVIVASGCGAVTSAVATVTVVPPGVYDGFDYPNASRVFGQNGGQGFAEAWSGSTLYTNVTGSLTVPGLVTSGGRVTGPASAGDSRRRQFVPFGANGTVKYLSGIVRPEVALTTGWLGYRLDGTGNRLFVGKPGAGATSYYVIENAGAALQVPTSHLCVLNSNVLLVVKCEFLAGNDRLTLYINPVPGEPEPASGTVKFNTDFGILTNVMLTASAAHSIDELRIGNTFEDVVPGVCVPVFYAQPSPTTAAAGLPMTLIARAAGQGPLSYQWRRNGEILANNGNVSGATSNTLVLNATGFTDTGAYDVVVTGGCSSSTSTVASVTVEPLLFLTQPQSQTVQEGGTAVLSVTVMGNAPLTYQWQHDGTDIPGATDATLTIPNAGPAHRGYYRARASNGFGSATSAVALLTVNLASLDNTFSAEASDDVFALAIQSDEKILLGGIFTQMNQLPRNQLARLHPNGTLDSGFDPNANGPAAALAIQSDGKILVGGNFTTLGGLSHLRIGRLNADGTPDSGFAPNANNYVWTLAVQPDGKVLVGGDFTMLNGQTHGRLGRLNADGSLDSGFAPDADSTVSSLTLQPDGKILVGGWFTTLNGASRNYVARLHTDGSLDTGFNPNVNDAVNAITVMVDGKIQIGGAFTTLSGQPRSRLARLNADGTLDNGSNLEADTTVHSLALQTDGKLLIGGLFSTLGGQTRNRLARLNADGTIDSGFHPASNGRIYALAVQTNGMILAGGEFTTLAGQARANLGRLINPEPATQSLSFESSTVTWMRGGTSPEVWRTSFEHSGNGLDWISLGEGTRINGGWQRIGVSIPIHHRIRARGFVAASDAASGWYVEAMWFPEPSTVPTIETQPLSQIVSAGSGVQFTVVASGSPAPTFQWRKNGVPIPGATSANLSLSAVDLQDEGSFDVIISNPLGQVTSQAAALTVQSMPGFLVVPESQYAPVGATVVLNSLAQGSPPISYQWYFNSQQLIGQTGATLTLANLQTSHAGEYEVVAINAFGQATSPEAVLTVLTPPSITSQPAGTNVAPGGVATFCVNATGSDPLRYQWRKNGANIPAQTGPCLIIDPVSLADGGSYSVVVANDAGTFTSDPALLVVLVPVLPPGDDFENRVPLTGTQIRGSNVNATKQPGEPDHAGQTGGRSVWYTRQAEGSGVVTIQTSGSTFDTLLAVYTGNAVNALTLVAADEDNAGFFSSRFQFLVSEGMAYHIAVDGFDGASGDFSLSWSLDTVAASLPVITLEPASQVVQAGAPVEFQVQATGLGLTYQWFFNNTPLDQATSSTYPIPSVTAAHVGLYRVRVTDQNNRSVDSRQAVLEIGTTPGVVSLDKINNPTTAGGGGGGNVISKPGPAAQGVTGGGGVILVAAGTTASQILNNTGAQTQPGEPNHCARLGGSTRWLILRPNQSLTLAIDTRGSAVRTILAVYTRASLFEPLSEITCAANESAESRVLVAAQANKDYWVAVDGLNGAQGVIQVNWALGQAPPNPDIATEMTAPLGDALVLKASNSGALPAPTFQWYLDGEPLLNQTNATLELNSLSADQAGRYSVMVSNSLGVVEQQVATLSVAFREILLWRSDFESGTEGWQIRSLSGGANGSPVHHAAVGDQSGYLTYSDGVNPDLWHWIAPAAVTGDWLRAYGGSLVFDWKRTPAASTLQAADVLLASGGHLLAYEVPMSPTESWSQARVPLIEGLGWRLNDLNGPPATRQDLVAALGAVEEWRIRGDHSLDPHSSALDDVRLSGPVEQSAVTLHAQVLPDGRLLIQWSEAASAFQLESSAAPQGQPWSPVSLAPEINQGLKQVLLDPPITPAFFRLRR